MSAGAPSSPGPTARAAAGNADYKVHERLVDALYVTPSVSPANVGLNNTFRVEPYHRPEGTVSPPHHLHIFSTKHNTHICLTKPDRNALISVATGVLGFRKSHRGTYDAAYQLAAFVMNRIQNEGLLPEIKKLEVVFRGFGRGRTAVTKALLGLEGRRLRDKVVRVTDSTRLKIGGTRSPKPRRLG